MPKPLGQHFLKNDAVIKKIITALELQPDDTIIEVGPGHGELTIPLAGACQKIGARVIAIERDQKLSGPLKLKLQDLKIENVEVVDGDALSVLAPQTKNLASFKIAGNIPYYITGHLFRVISELDKKPVCAVLMIQKEVAERICVAPPRMNRLAASVQFWADPKIIAHVPRADFSPAPAVDSAVIELITKTLTPETSATIDQYFKAVRAIFAQPRKTILNNISAGQTSTDATTDKKNGLATTLSELGIDPKSRPQDLSIENIQKIALNFSRWAVDNPVDK